MVWSKSIKTETFKIFKISIKTYAQLSNLDYKVVLSCLGGACGIMVNSVGSGLNHSNPEWGGLHFT